MIVKQIPMGNLEANCYIVINEQEKLALLIDTGFYNKNLADELDKLQNEGIDVKYILFTHGHFDHIAGGLSAKQKTGAQIVIHEGDADMLDDPMKNLSGSFLNVPIKIGNADIIVKDNSELELGSIKINVIATGGHSMGSCCYIIGDNLFTGDTLFKLSIGRTDFLGSNHSDMINSLKKLKEIKNDYKVYTGHGESTTLFFEQNNNPYM